MLKGLDDPSRIQPAVAGAFVSKLDVDPKFIAAVEAALGRSLQAVVLENTELAPEIIATLTNKKLGRPRWSFRNSVFRRPGNMRSIFRKKLWAGRSIRLNRRTRSRPSSLSCFITWRFLTISGRLWPPDKRAMKSRWRRSPASLFPSKASFSAAAAKQCPIPCLSAKRGSQS